MHISSETKLHFFNLCFPFHPSLSLLLCRYHWSFSGHHTIVRYPSSPPNNSLPDITRPHMAEFHS
jgi:hypothetical protein